MSKRINVNPDHYKVAGRERPDTLAAVEIQRARTETMRASWNKKQEELRRKKEEGKRQK